MKIKNVNILKDIEKLIKDDIHKKGLENTGKMLKSIRILPAEDGFKVHAIDYFYWVDKEYDILKDVMESSEFKNLIIKAASEFITDELKNI